LVSEPTTEEFLQEVIAGLEQQPKTLPTKYLYDERGSRLFDQICQLQEYYVTRTELEIMRRYGAEMADCLGDNLVLVELGSGSSTKTRILLDHLRDPVAYLPVDISRAHLHYSAASIARSYPNLNVLPVCADFTTQFEIPIVEPTTARKAVYLPGSTIGNFPHKFAQQLILRIAEICGAGGGLLIGIDLQKDEQMIVDAYNDADGVTAQFNLNLLRRINRELGADFDLDNFAHEAPYRREHDRIEMLLVSQCDQVVTLGDEAVELAAGESIRTEFSHKYTVSKFARLASGAGFALERCWTDDQRHFAVLYFAIGG
jgi:dimethylhistidine N-methyltransferase